MKTRQSWQIAAAGLFLLHLAGATAAGAVNPSLAVTGDGGVTIAWQRYNSPSFYRRYSATDQPLGPPQPRSDVLDIDPFHGPHRHRRAAHPERRLLLVLRPGATSSSCSRSSTAPRSTATPGSSGGSLSNVDYDITVMDTGTGSQKVYRNRNGKLTSQADTEAF